MSVDHTPEPQPRCMRKLSPSEWDDLIIAVETRAPGTPVHQITGPHGVSPQRLYIVRKQRLPALVESGRLPNGATS